MPSIVSLQAREILDSRAQPTLEVEVALDCGTRARASVPSGASKGSHEACELRDGDKGRYGGRGVLGSVDLVNGEIASLLSGYDACEQTTIDEALCALDRQGALDRQEGAKEAAAKEDKDSGEDANKYVRSKSYLGAQASLAVSSAVARAAANSLSLPLFRHLGGVRARVLPLPQMNILNGGAHAGNALDVQEFMIVPHGARDFAEGLRMGVEVYASLKSCLSQAGHSLGLGDEGGFAPELRSTVEALDLLMRGITATGLRCGEDVSLALDCAASEYCTHSSGFRYKFDGKEYSSSETIDCISSWVSNYPIVSIEDALAEDDWQGWRDLTSRLGKRLGDSLLCTKGIRRVQLVGDDLFATNASRLERGIAEGCATALLLKANQIGTISEALSCGDLALRSGFGCIVSHRSGDTEDSFIADLSVALGCGQIKTGAPARSERVSKYNRLLRICEILGTGGIYGSGEFGFSSFGLPS